MATPALTAHWRPVQGFLVLATSELRLRLRDHPSSIRLQPLILHVTCLTSHCARDDHEVQNRLQADSLNCGSENSMLLEQYDDRQQLSVRKPSLTQK